jgi:hypothetical protein
MFGIPTKALVYGGIVLGILAAFGLYTRWVFQQGVGSERAAIVERSLSRTAERNKDDEEIRNLDLDGLCREYGGTRWLPDAQRCERR